ncbi:MAG TPA: thioredoxin TrxC [Devosia sp.]|nr:thioredoxin TrxC [Devosia sp.]
MVCTGCGTVNRIAAGRPTISGKCGKCSAALFSDHPPDISGSMLERQIAKSGIPVLVDVWAPWCGPCKMMGPQFDAAAKEAGAAMRFVKLNSDENRDISVRLGIRGIPTMLMFEDGKEVARISGALSKADILKWGADHQGLR